MRTQAQIDAARRNGAKSHGPITAEGKQKSSRNATRHGLQAQFTVVLANESNEAFQAVLDSYISHFLPANQVEHDLVVEIATSRWRLRRVWEIETALIDQEMADQHASFTNSEDFPEMFRTASAWKSLATGPGSLGLLNRYETRIRNSYTRSIREFFFLRNSKLNAPAPNEPKTQDLPQAIVESSQAFNTLPNEPRTLQAEAQHHSTPNRTDILGATLSKGDFTNEASFDPQGSIEDLGGCGHVRRE